MIPLEISECIREINGLYELLVNNIETSTSMNKWDRIRRYHQAMGHPNWTYFKNMLLNKKYNEIDITISDVDEFMGLNEVCLGCMREKSIMRCKNHQDNLHKIDYCNDDFSTMFGDVM